MNYKLEVIAFNIESCRVIEQCGADRIELCDNPGEGGTTASYGLIQAARQHVSIELYPIIRPRGGDFLYGDDEFDIMKADVQLCRKLGCDGIVTGMLHADGRVDTQRCSQLVELAYPMEVTFHRAFDRTADVFSAMEDIIAMGCKRILTSGQKPAALEATDLIAKLLKQADDRIIIMPGSGLRSDNIITIAERTKAVEFHTSARSVLTGKMNYTNPAIKDEGSVIADADEIKNIIANLKRL